MSINRPSVSLESSITASYFAEGAIKQYMAVKKGTLDNQVKPLDSGDTAVTVIVGFALNDADSGASVPICIEGPCMARAQGAVTRDNALEAIYNATAEKNGNVKTITTCAGGAMIAGRALEDAADTAYFLIYAEIRKQLAVA